MLKTIAGMKDILPSEISQWHYVEKICMEVFKNFNYKEIRTPILEMTALFKRGVGETTDIVEKEMYTFEDRDKTSLSLRPEGTAPVVRAYIQNKLFNEQPVTKLYYMGEMYRHERPQKGRYRAFHQIGAEYFGATSPLADAEIISLISEILNRLDIKSYVFYINTIGCQECRPKYKEALKGYFSNHFDNLCEHCQKRLETNPLRVLDCKNSKCKEIAESSPIIIDYVCDTCKTHHEELIKLVDLIKIPYRIDYRIVRGLDYYVRTTFEVKEEGGILGAQNTILGGGRYNGLVSQLEGPETEAIGFAIGVERLLYLLENISNSEYIDYVVIPLGKEQVDMAFKIATSLRIKGFSVDIDPRSGSLKSQMRWANKLGVKSVILIGENELKNSSYIEKNMETSEQKVCSIYNILN